MDVDTDLAFASGSAFFVADEELEIILWSEAAERLTGLPSEEVVGRRCWEVIAGKDDAGGLACHQGCSRGRHLREGRRVPAVALHARTVQGRRRIMLDTITVTTGSGSFFVNVMHDAPKSAVDDPGLLRAEGRPHLTARQDEILRILSEGQPAKSVARRLGLSETTVRNHIRAILVELGAHSQLEAVARARTLKLI